ncbi:Uncharacterised protein [Mycobacteroides abscessus subsp. abscessus]|uniref:hypothetical protein n=1 Tax=Mycobacteroides abscessus TaxID=36809 RepID=UPI00092BBF59|nr:hypothetical protein [Mycobacteroides abscessus]SHP85312.1 Uncharacterised protein [Mycobacteroides abscessus subsp. abscessus]
MTNTDNPNPIDDPGVPEQHRAALVGMSQDFATARRLTAALAGADYPAIDAIVHEIVASGRGTEVLLAVAAEHVRLAGEVFGDAAEAWLVARAARQLDLAEHNRHTFGD